MQHRSSKGLTLSFLGAVLGGVTVLLRWPGATGAFAAATIILAYAVYSGFKVGWSFGEDAADSLYFLGFSLTVSLLALSFLRAPEELLGMPLEIVLESVGQGLLLTVWGLVLRQVAILNSVGIADADAAVGTPLAAVASSPEIERPSPTQRHVEALDAAEKEVLETLSRMKRLSHELAQTVSTVVGNVRQASGSLHGVIEEASGHLSEASTMIATNLAESSYAINQSLKSTVAKVVAGYDSATSSLDKHGRQLLDASERHSESATFGINSLTARGTEATNLALEATAAMEAGSLLLKTRVDSIPDPSAPARDYATALSAASVAVTTAGDSAAEAARLVSNVLGTIHEQLRSINVETARTVAAAHESLELVRNHFSLFASLQEEYVKLVESVSGRAVGTRR